MVDRGGRDKLAFALRQFIAGRISERDWEESLPRSTKDLALDDIADQLEFSFENYLGKDYSLIEKDAITPEERKILARCLAFLYSDLDYGDAPPQPTGIRSAIRYLTAPIAFIAVTAVVIPAAIVCTIYESLFHRGKPKKEDDLWPFKQKSDLEQVLAEPKLLSGNDAAPK